MTFVTFGAGATETGCAIDTEKTRAIVEARRRRALRRGAGITSPLGVTGAKGRAALREGVETEAVARTVRGTETELALVARISGGALTDAVETRAGSAGERTVGKGEGSGAERALKRGGTVADRRLETGSAVLAGRRADGDRAVDTGPGGRAGTRGKRGA